MLLLDVLKDPLTELWVTGFVLHDSVHHVLLSDLLDNQVEAHAVLK